MGNVFIKKNDIIKVCNVLYDDFFIVEVDNTENIKQQIVDGCTERQWRDEDVRLVYPSKTKRRVM